MTDKKITREEWLHKIVTHARPMFIEAGAPLPEEGKLRVAIGLPFRSRTATGQCWHSTAAKDKGREIWVSPVLASQGELSITGTLVHELCHAALPDETGHKAPFSNLGKALHLTGKPTEMGGRGEAFKEVWGPILKEVGPYPGQEFNPGLGGMGKPKQKTYLLKFSCNSCGAIWRMTQSSADKATGDFSCPCCRENDIEIG
jgi:hypothetical protein